MSKTCKTCLAVEEENQRLESLLTAAEKRATEAAASAAEGLEVLQLITEEFECRCSSLQDQAAICVRCHAQEVIKHLPARAQAVAEVLEALRKWYETESRACELFMAIGEYFAKLDAARKGT